MLWSNYTSKILREKWSLNALVVSSVQRKRSKCKDKKDWNHPWTTPDRQPLQTVEPTRPLLPPATPSGPSIRVAEVWEDESQKHKSFIGWITSRASRSQHSSAIRGVILHRNYYGVQHKAFSIIIYNWLSCCDYEFCWSTQKPALLEENTSNLKYEIFMFKRDFNENFACRESVGLSKITIEQCDLAIGKRQIA